MIIVVITGCSSGIGLATAMHLKEQGITVYPTVRNEEDILKLKELGFKDVKLLDVTNPYQISNVINYVLEKHNRIDVWFNNAGYGQPGAIEDLPTEILRKQFETNVFGLHECTRQILPVMQRQGSGKIIQHSSVLGLISLFGRGAYNASKYAVEGLTDTLRLELAGTNIYPILLNTGPITSSFRDNAMQNLKTNINIEKSRYKKIYLKNIGGTGKRVPFNEDVRSVAKVVHNIIMTPKPKPRYYITKATYLLGYLKRALSTRMVDKILIKI